MGKRNRHRQQNRVIQQQKTQAAQLQPQSVPVATVAQHTQEAYDLGRAEAMRELAETSPAPPQFAPVSARRFGEPRIFRLDCGLKVTVEGDEETLEQEVFLRCDSDKLEVLTGDAALQRRIAKQQGAPVFAIQTSAVQTPAPQRSLSPAAPPGVGDPVRRPDLPYDGIGPRPKQHDFQDRVLAEVGIDLRQLAGAASPMAAAAIAQLASEADEELLEMAQG